MGMNSKIATIKIDLDLSREEWEHIKKYWQTFLSDKVKGCDINMDKKIIEIEVDPKATAWDLEIIADYWQAYCTAFFKNRDMEFPMILPDMERVEN